MPYYKGQQGSSLFSIVVLSALFILMAFGLVSAYFIFKDKDTVDQYFEQKLLSKLPHNRAVIKQENLNGFTPRYYQPGEAIVQDVDTVQEFLANIPCELVLGVKEENAIMGELYFPDFESEYDEGKNVRALYCLDAETVGTNEPSQLNLRHSGIARSYKIEVETLEGESIEVLPSALLRARVGQQDLIDEALRQNPEFTQ